MMASSEFFSSLVAEQIAQHGFSADFTKTVAEFYVPLAKQVEIAARHANQEKDKPLFLGIYGSQGSGKSTFASFLKLILEHKFDTSCVVMSLDDFYLTRKERQQLANSVHPLLETRGVPGTHDIPLLWSVLEQLMTASGSQDVRVPTFNKALDDRDQGEVWQVISKKPKVIVLEGWCVGVQPQSPESLKEPINEFERDFDQDGRWRNYVNQQTAGDYRSIFDSFDRLIALVTPGFECVYEWRLLQESKLKEKLVGSGQSLAATMSEQQIEHFIAHYQRLTEHALKTIPSIADWCLFIDKSHSITHLESKVAYNVDA